MFSVWLPGADRGTGMIRSMTGFARVERQGDWGALHWELRSVNHRYLDISLRLPEELRAQESVLRQRIADSGLRRGKLDAQLRLASASNAAGAMEIDSTALAAVLELSREVGAQLTQAAPLSPLEVLRWPGVVREPQTDLAAVQAAANEALDEALAALMSTRADEGARTQAMLSERLDAIEPLIAGVRRRLPEVLENQRTRLQARLDELDAAPDNDRLEQELVLLAQKLDVAEELDRLDSHVTEFRQALTRDEAVGRRLDFLLQEFNREANTLSSKSQDTAMTSAAVELKVLIEQMREQVQNVE